MSDDRIAEIRARHEDNASIGSIIHGPDHPPRWTLVGWKAHHDRAFLLLELDRVSADNERLREALRWYADQENHFPVHVHHRRAGYPDPVAVFIKEPQIMDDCGRRARAALEGKP